MSVESRRELVRLAIKADGNMAAAEFRLADKNRDGLLDLAEFQTWLSASGAKGGREGVSQVTQQQQVAETRPISRMRASDRRPAPLSLWRVSGAGWCSTVS